MSSDSAPVALTPEELLKRQKEVRKLVVMRGLLLGLLVSAWWIFFLPDSIMEAQMKYILGVVVGVLATGSYLFNLRATLTQKAAKD